MSLNGLEGGSVLAVPAVASPGSAATIPLDRTRYRRLQARLFEIMETAHADDVAHRVYTLCMMAIVAVNILTVILETEPMIDNLLHPVFHTIDVVAVVVFTVEYLLRLWVCTSDPRYHGAVWGRLRFATTPLAVVDLVAILPFFLPVLVSVDVEVLRALRLFRLVRALKLVHYSAAMQRLGSGLRRKKEELVVAMAAMVMLLVVASTLIYLIEHQAQPQAFSSIPAALWWGTTTLATVGYGDVYPITPLGKFVAAIISMLGVGLFALPAGILASAFGQANHHPSPVPVAHRLCPHCGRDIGASGAASGAPDRLAH